MQTHSTKIILKPRITEKSTMVSELNNAYVFEVSKDANKHSIKKAFKDLYNVSPKKINIIKLPSKKIVSKGKVGKTKQVIKAQIFLAKGEKIELM